jgi:hypothetical protein
VPKNWHKIIMEALIISSFPYIYNKINKTLNIIYNYNMSRDKNLKIIAENLYDKKLKEMKLKEECKLLEKLEIDIFLKKQDF